jgi:NAD(P)-dependent dehydrogenase (short-subunit alcohol dehydrogenase family)
MNAAFLDAVIVTGAGRGLGREVALMAGGLGVPVLCLGRSANIEGTREEIAKRGGAAECLSLDLADFTEVEKRVGGWIAAKSFRRMAVVLAAGDLGARGGLLDSDLQSWARTFQTNVLGNLAVVKGLLQRMREARFGRIVSIAGGGAAYGYPLFSGYANSKAALVRAAENLDLELRGHGDFSIVCLAPGAMETGMLAQVRAAGAEVRTTVPIAEPVEFVREFILAEACGFSGRFVHVRDDWKSWLTREEVPGNRWLLRRIEA